MNQEKPMMQRQPGEAEEEGKPFLRVQRGPEGEKQK